MTKKGKDFKIHPTASRATSFETQPQLYGTCYLFVRNTPVGRLDVERRYLEDITPRYFKSWLKKQAPGPLVTQMFADPLFPPRGPRSLYEAHIRAHYSPVERDDFVHLWKLMLLQT